MRATRTLISVEDAWPSVLQESLGADYDHKDDNNDEKQERQ